MDEGREAPRSQSSEPLHFREGTPRTRRLNRSQRHSQRSVFQYIAILFAAALVLLLYTFMMERRQFEQLQKENQENISNLERSASAVQRLQGIYNENASLKEQIQALEAEKSQLEKEIKSLRQSAAEQETRLEHVSQAMDWFWQINEAFVRGRYTKCRELIASLENAGLAGYLPKESATANDRFSPADRYQEIYSKVIQ